MDVLTDDNVDAAAAAADTSWYKDAIIYQLHVKAFADSNDDGVGDFAGLTEKLDYLQDLGVTALWLLPFYPSPGRDDGYDIADYRKINPDFGTLKDFRRFMIEAKRRGLRVITELVINHTSDQHPWFKRARRSRPGSSARNWYVWSDTDQRYLDTRIIFTDTEKSNWAWDPDAGAYYWHRFFSHQPDLNFDNPRVLWAIVQVMRRWLDMGVDGFRLDAIPYLCEREGTNNENLPETHAVIRKLRAELDAYAPGKLLLAEANQWPEDVSAYFGEGDECHMAYHFPLMPRIYMAIAQEDRFPIADILRQTPDIPDNCQWALFLRNHDELTLEMVTDSERDYLWSTYATDPRARINLGIRRRLATLMDNDRRKIELMNSLLLSLPGTPVIYYGDEIGMGDNIYLGDRNGVRTPMQWTPDRNGGFSRCDPAKLFLPPIQDAVYGYQALNVEAQSRSLSSLLSWMKRLIAVRKSSPVFGRGTLTFVRQSNRSVIAYVRQHEGETIFCVANLSRAAQAAEFDLSQWRGRVPLEMLGRSRFPAITDAPFLVTLAPYGFFWFQLLEQEEGAETPAAMPELPTLVVRDGWHSVLEGRFLQAFERDVLPVFLASRRWFAEKANRWFDARVDSAIPVTPGNPGFAWAQIEVAGERGKSCYALPLGVNWSRFDYATPHIAATGLAPVRRGAREGVLYDAATDRDFIAWLVRSLHEGAVMDGPARALRFTPTDEFRAMELPPIEEVKPLAVEQSNTTIRVNGCIVKLFRKMQAGVNPEIEIGRFLTDVAKYENAPRFLGAVELQKEDERFALAVAHAYVENQGDGWNLTNTYLDRFLEEYRLLSPSDSADPEQHAALLLRVRLLGRRIAELHAALGSSDADPAFAPEPITPDDIAAWTRDLRATAERVLSDLRGRLEILPETAQALATALLGQRDALMARIDDALPPSIDADKIRTHGDLHLGQILIVKDDVFIIDFEGEPGRSVETRGRKMPAARDVAGMLRSIDYAGAAALERMVQAEDRPRLEAAVQDCRRQSERALLDAYRETLGDSRLIPAEPEIADRLLDFFVLEKAIYEVEYELSNRPAWLHIPLTGILRLFAPVQAEVL
ncbi:MAG: maltose alpha-D-glucosyltransferase [Variibacter sp.]